MGSKKRPLSPEDCKDPGNKSTESLCRAVKRLHTYSPLTSSCTTASKDTGASGAGESGVDEEASSCIQPAGEGSSPQFVSQVPDSSAGVLWTSQDESRLGRHHLPTRTARPSTSQSDTAQVCSHAQQSYAINAPRCNAAVLSGSRPGKDLSQQPEGDPDSAGTAKENAPPAQAEVLQSTLSGMQQGLNSIQRRLAGIAVASDDLDDSDSVAQPSTPARDECPSPVAAKGHVLGTSRSNCMQKDAYALMYEEANMLLKNLHFERLQRKVQS